MAPPRVRDHVLEASIAKANKWLPKNAQIPQPSELDEQGFQPVQNTRAPITQTQQPRAIPFNPQRRQKGQPRQRRFNSQSADRRARPRGLRFRPDTAQARKDRFAKLPLQLSRAAENRLDYWANIEERRKYYGRIPNDNEVFPFNGVYLWPWEDDPDMVPEKMLGAQLEAFDDIRIDERVFICIKVPRVPGVDETRFVIKVMGRSEEHVQRALERVKNAAEEIMSNCSQTSRVLLVEPPPSNVTGVHLQDRPSSIGEPFSKTPKEPIGTVAAPLVDFGGPVMLVGNEEDRKSRRYDNALMRKRVLASGLIDVHALRKQPKLRVSVGAFQLLQYRTPKDEATGLYDFAEFYSMTQRYSTKWRIAPDSFTEDEMFAFLRIMKMGILPAPSLVIVIVFEIGRGDITVLERQYQPVGRGEYSTVDRWSHDEKVCLDTATLYLDRNIGIQTSLSASQVINPEDLLLKLRKLAQSIKLTSTNPPAAMVTATHGCPITWSTQSTVYTYGLDGVTIELRRNADLPMQQPKVTEWQGKYPEPEVPRRNSNPFEQLEGLSKEGIDTDDDETDTVTSDRPIKQWSVRIYKPLWDQTFANQDSVGVGTKPNWAPKISALFTEGLDSFYNRIEQIRQALAEATEPYSDEFGEDGIVDRLGRVGISGAGGGDTDAGGASMEMVGEDEAMLAAATQPGAAWSYAAMMNETNELDETNVMKPKNDADADDQLTNGAKVAEPRVGKKKDKGKGKAPTSGINEKTKNNAKPKMPPVEDTVEITIGRVDPPKDRDLRFRLAVDEDDLDDGAEWA